jgi:hypothetical protein
VVKPAAGCAPPCTNPAAGPAATPAAAPAASAGADAAPVGSAAETNTGVYGASVGTPGPDEKKVKQSAVASGADTTKAEPSVGAVGADEKKAEHPPCTYDVKKNGVLQHVPCPVGAPCPAPYFEDADDQDAKKAGQNVGAIGSDEKKAEHPPCTYDVKRHGVLHHVPCPVGAPCPAPYFEDGDDQVDGES